MGNLLQITAKFERTNTVVSANPRSWLTFPRQDTVVIGGTIIGDDLTGLAVTGTLKVWDSELLELVTVDAKTATITDTTDSIKRYQIVIAEPADTAAFDAATFHFDIQAVTNPTVLGAVPLVRTILGGFKTVDDYTTTV